MADKKTPNIGLTLTIDEKTLFKDWRDIINGEGTEENPSNAQIVDKAIGALSDSKQDKIDSSNKLDFNLVDNVPAFVTVSVDNLTNYYKKSETYTQDEINNLLEKIDKISFKKVNSVEEVTESGYIYLVPSTTTGSDNIYDEYIFIDNKAELIGSTKIDLDDYYNKEEISNLLNDKQDKIDADHKLDYDLLSNTPEIPTVPENISAFTNDANYITASTEDLTNYYKKSDTYTKEEVNTELNKKENIISDLDTIRSGATLGATAIQEETDPTVPAYVKNITEADISNWNNKSDFSGDYNDLINKPTIVDIKANPEEEAAESLEKIKINDTVYNFPVASGATKEDIYYLKGYIDYLLSLHGKKLVDHAEDQEGSITDKIIAIDNNTGDEYKIIAEEN